MIISLDLKLFLIIIYVTNLRSKEIKIIENGGYNARFCINYLLKSINFIKLEGNVILFKCQKLNQTRNDCKNKSVYLCPIPCQFKEPNIKINREKTKIKYLTKPKFEIADKIRIYYSNANLTISSDDSLSLLMDNEINIDFSSNISCSRKYIQNKSIICTLESFTSLSNHKNNKINITLSYGNNCKTQIFVGSISFSNNSQYNLTIYISSILTILIITISIITICTKFRSTKTIENEVKIIKKNLQNQKIEFSNIQNKAFYEYQIAIQSFNNIGKFTSRYLYSFNDFISKLLTVDIIENEINFCSQDFENILLKKTTLVQWIEKVELICKVKDKCVLASYLTLYLMHNPKYFLEVMRCLIKNLIKEKHRNFNDNSQQSPRSNMIIEKIIGYWSTICLYENLKTSDMGERLFNLYRGIKSKTESGLVDCFSCKAKYALSFDNLILGDIEYQTLIIDVTVKMKIRLMNTKELIIEMDQLTVSILSLDSISQVKEKIIDKAFMEYVKKESLDDSDDSCLCIAPISHTDFKLIYMKSNIKIQLDDFDDTSIKTIFDKKCIIVNTAKHYNIKNGTKFLLTQDSMFPMGFSPIIKRNFQPTNELAIHLQIPGYLNVDKNESNYSVDKKKLIYTPIRENTNKDAYLFMLMATKKSMIPLIDGFIQSITLWKPENNNTLSPGSKSASYDELISTDLSSSIKIEEELERKPCSLKSVFHLFTLYDEIAKSLFIFDKDLINMWKSNCYIHQVWANLITNPELIFPITVEPAVRGSLETVAHILKESCFMESIYSGIELDLPIIKQIFIDDIKSKYSLWWQAFIEAQENVTDEEMIEILSDIVMKNQLQRYKSISLKVLQMLSKTLLIEEIPEETYQHRKNIPLPTLDCNS